MCEQAETFCRKTWTGLVQVAHLKVSVRAGLDIVISLVCCLSVIYLLLVARSTAIATARKERILSPGSAGCEFRAASLKWGNFTIIESVHATKT